MKRPVPVGLAVRLLILVAILAITVRILMPEPPSPHGQPTWIEEQGATMGSTYRLTIASPFGNQDKQATANLILELRKILTDTEQQISTWKIDSQLSQFNRQVSTDWFAVDEHTVNMLKLAQELSAIDRRFDITVASLSDLWGLGPRLDPSPGSSSLSQDSRLENDRPRLEPTASDIDDCLQHVGSHKLELRSKSPALRKLDPLVRIDLSAIAAGYVADRIAQMLIERGATDFYLEVAGEIVVHGHNRNGEKWRVGIAEPKAGSRSVQRVLELSDCAVATSGNYRNFIEVGGQRYGHILDPTSGYPVTTDVLSATVIHPTCARADGLVTLLMTMPSEEALTLANQHGWQVLLLVSDGDQVREVSNLKH